MPFKAPELALFHNPAAIAVRLYVREGENRPRYRPVTSDELSRAASVDVASRLVGKAIASPAESQAYLSTALAGRDSEVFAVLFLDNRHRVIAFEEMFHGTVDNTTVYPREVAKRALTLNAAAVILAHNHPSGVPEPSDADRLITRRLRDALELIDVRLLDHFVIGHGSVVSLASRGML